jgi:murein DD-endopeptidase MepM/ murein hydrolase activator NlpD/muramidase (phage lysozyme)
MIDFVNAIIINKKRQGGFPVVVTLKPYAKAVIGIPNYDQSAPIRFAFRLLTRTGAIIRDFGTLDNYIVGYSDSHGENGAQWTIRLRNTGESRELLRDLHPGIIAEIYASRGADPLLGIVRNPAAVPRKDSTPDLPTIENQVTMIQPTGTSDIGALTTGIYQGMHPNVAAFLEMVRDGEGTKGDRGFTTMFTGAQLSGFSSHPAQLQSGGGYTSDAAGAWQFLSTTWNPTAAKLGLKDFSPRSQALGAQQLLKDKGIYEAVVRGDLTAALSQGSYIWASLPAGPGQSGRYGQPNHTYSEVVKIYEQAKQSIGGRVSTDPNAVGPAFPLPPATAPQVAKVSAGPDTSRAGKVTMARTGQKDSNNLEILRLTVHDKSGNPLGAYSVNSGIAQTQDKFGGFGTTRSGSKAPVEFGEYRIGAPVASGLEGVGRTFIPVDPTSATERSAIGFHVDADRDKAAGSAGCIVFATTAEFDKFQADLEKSGATTFVFEKEPVAASSAIAAPAAGAAATGSPIGEPVPPQEDTSGLDASPYLLMRGCITAYGRQATTSGATLTISGEDFGLVYREATVIAATHAPELAAASIEERAGLLWIEGISLSWYRLLSRYVERLNTGAVTGIEARTRVIPVPVKIFSKILVEGSVWENLKRLSLAGLFHCKIDHTGAIDWAKKPYSGRDQALVPGQSWEDLPLYELEPWQVISIDDRYTDRGIANYIRVSPTIGLMGGADDNAGLGCTVWNTGSRVQYGTTREAYQYPMGLPGPNQWYTSPDLRTQQATGNTLSLLSACEMIRWFDRPQQALMLTLRGDAFIRIGTRIKIAETWHGAGAKPAEYYILSRSHSIDLENGAWTTSVDVVRDRRTRYLNIGDADRESPFIADEAGRIAVAQQAAGSLKPFAAWTEHRGATPPRSNGKKPSPKPNDLKILPPPEINVPISPDHYVVCHPALPGCVDAGPDIIGWAKRDIIPRLGELGKVQEVIMPTADTGSVQTGPAGPGGGKFIAPFRSGLALGSVYDPSGTLNSRGRRHVGVDLFPSSEGDNTMVALADGIVSVKATGCQVGDYGCGGGYGNYFEIAFSGTWSGWSALYAHCDRILVSNGPVKAGQAVAIMGSTGGSSGPHLHLEIRKGGTLVNPMRYLPAPSQRFTSDAGADMFAGG